MSIIRFFVPSILVSSFRISPLLDNLTFAIVQDQEDMPPVRGHIDRNQQRAAPRKNPLAKRLRDNAPSSSIAMSAKMQPSLHGAVFDVTIHTLSKPNIRRLLRVPPTLTFHNFHKVLQIAFGWKSHNAFYSFIATSVDVDMFQCDSSDPTEEEKRRLLTL